jgi:2,3-bisphosphoglycerate-dependent phosphoglycerate mutase
VPVNVVFETHSITEDNEAGIATGWNPGQLSTAGVEAAHQLGQRRRDESLDAVFTSDLQRATQTAGIAFHDHPVPLFHDWRLRECNYGDRNGTPSAELDRGAHVDRPYPGGESWQEAIDRVGLFLAEVARRWDRRRVLVIGHTATRWALDHFVRGIAVADLVDEDFAWQEGWEYSVG